MDITETRHRRILGELHWTVAGAVEEHNIIWHSINIFICQIDCCPMEMDVPSSSHFQMSDQESHIYECY
jgi:hypothetical protein